MSMKRAIITEGLPAFRTHEGLLSSVASFMGFDITERTEGLPTLGTYKGFLPSVDSFMYFEITRGTKGFSTLHTRIGLHCGVSLLMSSP